MRTTRVARLVLSVAALSMVAAACGGGDQGSGAASAEDVATSDSTNGRDDGSAESDVDSGDDYPSRPIEIVVPYSPGGVTDRVGRVVTSVAQKYVDVPLRQVTMPGGGAADGTRYVVEAEPDGYTLNFGGSGSVLSVSELRDVGYQYDDLTPIALTSWSNITFNVAADSPYETLEDLVEAARANPGGVTYSTAGAGGTGHVVADYFSSEHDLEFTHVPFDGAAEADVAVMGGHVDFSVTGVGTTIGPISEGLMRSLGVTSLERDALLPDVPTFEEAGYPFEYIVWRGLFAPAEVPDHVIDFWLNVMEQVHADEEYQQLMESIEPTIFEPNEEAAARISREAEQLAPIYAEIRQDLD